MLTRFAIDPNSLVTSLSADLQSKEDRILDFLEFWESHGVLVDSEGTNGTVSLGEMLLRHDFLDVNLRDLLSNAYEDATRFRQDTEGCRVDWASIDNPDMLKNYENTFELALLEGRHATNLGLGKDDTNRFCVHCGEIEVSEWRFTKRACQVSQAISDSRTPMPLDRSASQIWRERFQRYAQYSQHVVLVDRYAAEFEGANLNSSLVNMFCFLNTDSYQCTITILTTMDNRLKTARNIERALERVKRENQLDNLRKVAVYLYQPHRKFPRDRWLSFNRTTFMLHGVSALSPTNRKPGEQCVLLDPIAAEKYRKITEDLRKQNDDFCQIT